MNTSEISELCKSSPSTSASAADSAYRNSSTVRHLFSFAPSSLVRISKKNNKLSRYLSSNTRIRVNHADSEMGDGSAGWTFQPVEFTVNPSNGKVVSMDLTTTTSSQNTRTECSSSPVAIEEEQQRQVQQRKEKPCQQTLTMRENNNSCSNNHHNHSASRSGERFMIQERRISRAGFASHWVLSTPSSSSSVVSSGLNQRKTKSWNDQAQKLKEGLARYQRSSPSSPDKRNVTMNMNNTSMTTTATTTATMTKIVSAEDYRHPGQKSPSPTNATWQSNVSPTVPASHPDSPVMTVVSGIDERSWTHQQQHLQHQQQERFIIDAMFETLRHSFEAKHQQHSQELETTTEKVKCQNHLTSKPKRTTISIRELIN